MKWENVSVEVGHEYGEQLLVVHVSGAGLDSVVMRHKPSCFITNLFGLIDVLSGLDTVKICVAYDLDVSNLLITTS